jgi:hypothetical protein
VDDDAVGAGCPPPSLVEDHETMSATASFFMMPRSAIDGLRKSAVPRKRLFGKPKDTYWKYLRDNGREAARYAWSGYVLGTLLPYLEEHHDIQLMKSEFDELSTYLTNTRGATCFVFTETHKRHYLEKLAPQSYSLESLRDYYDDFNGVHEPVSGRWMLDGIQCLRECLAGLNPDSVIVFSIA